MTSGEIVTLLFIAFVSAGMTTLIWRQFGDLRGENVGLRQEMAELRTGLQGEMADFRAEVRDEFRALRSEMHSDIAALRADLTQVALAVGANRPQASGS